MKQDVLRQMGEYGSSPELHALLEAMPEGLTVVVKDGVGDWLPLAAGHDDVAGIYMNRTHLHLLLTPADGRALAAETGCRLVKVNRETAYVRVQATEAAQHAATLVPYVEKALRRSAHRAGKDPGEDRNFGAAARGQRTCPTSFERVPVSGICDLHGAVCLDPALSSTAETPPAAESSGESA